VAGKIPSGYPLNDNRGRRFERVTEGANGPKPTEKYGPNMAVQQAQQNLEMCK
jgi:hypothetical protein